MEHVISIVKELFQDIASALNISAEILLYAILGVLVVLLILLMIVNKKPTKQKKAKEGKERSHKKGSDFWEVGPEPVIVYEREKIKDDTPPEPELELKLEPTPPAQAEPQPLPESKPQQAAKFEFTPDPQAAPEFEFNPEPETQPELKLDFTPEPEAKPEPEFDFTPEPEIQPEPKFNFTSEVAPKAQRDLPPEPEPLPVTPPTYTSPFQRYMSADPGEEAATAFKPALAQDPLPHLESDFASEILLLFSKQNFTIEKVVYHGTYGADFIVSSKGVKTYVQVKDWKKKATPRTVQEARYYSNTNNCHNTILIPLAGYTSAANKEAGLRAVLLWNAKTIKKLRNGDQTLEQLIAASSF